MNAFEKKPGGTSLIEQAGAGGPTTQVGKRTLTEDLTPAAAAQQAVATDGGAPLPDDVRVRMERKLRADFSQVRVHSGAQAERGGQAINAPAYAVGHNILLRAGLRSRA